MHCSNCGTKIEYRASFCQKCGNKTTDGHFAKEISNKDKQTVVIEYFAISTGRLVLFSILTFGIYEIYWFYKNWQAVKEFEKIKISPFWRAIFAVFFCYSLFKRVLESAKTHNYQNSYSPGWLATIYILLLLIGNGLNKVDSYDMAFNFFWLVVVVSTFIPLLSVQKAINFNNEKINKGIKFKRGFSGGEVALIVMGVILFILILLGIFLS